ncbi:hypothetical protein CVT24_003070 [Panaeolus cyanescens]|uniref:Uncharacterized protein n=1 Tax=Panaeolus cyanescens TaxID=181874 RepID=A0A409VFT4_9AGAR|nr:hypothetical protein CVT24_003070 [Panaeolus cyanescens]
MSYIKSLRVVYGDNRKAVSGEDINKGFGGEYSYLVPVYTENPSEAATAFSITITSMEELNADDLCKGDGKHERFVYLNAHYSLSNGPPIKRLSLSEKEEGIGYTIDLNKGRGGRFLYLNWWY